MEIKYTQNMDSVFSVKVHAVECETGWTVYKDETCIRAFSELLSYDEARQFCSSKSNSLSSATLVSVKDSDMQVFLENYTQDIYEHIWLGAKFDATSDQFLWDDGEPLTYANWADGFPRNVSDTEMCIHIRPVNAKESLSSNRNWEDAVCQRRNLVMCQRTVTWTMEDATREILKLRKQLQEQISSSAEERNHLQQQLQDVNAKVVPVGSIYVEYYDQPSPVSLWPTLQWEDITSSYGGSFFRALGGNSESWGTTQAECAPRISHVEYNELQDPAEGTHFIQLPSGGWSDLIFTGSNFNTGEVKRERLKFHVETCEVHPTNQAVRIWKRLV